MIEKLTKKFQAWVIPWFASGIGMVYSTAIIPLWIAFIGAHITCFAFIIFYAVKLNIAIWKDRKFLEEKAKKEQEFPKGADCHGKY